MNARATNMRYGLIFSALYLSITALACIIVRLKTPSIIFALGVIFPFFCAIVLTSLSYYRREKRMITFPELFSISFIGAMAIQLSHLFVSNLNPGLREVTKHFGGNSIVDAILFLPITLIGCMLFLAIALRLKIFNSVLIKSEFMRAAYYGILFTLVFVQVVVGLAILNSPPLAALVLSAMCACVIVSYLFIRHHGRSYKQSELRNISLTSSVGFVLITLMAQNFSIGLFSSLMGILILPLFIAACYFGAMDQLMKLDIRPVKKLNHQLQD